MAKRQVMRAAGQQPSIVCTARSAGGSGGSEGSHRSLHSTCQWTLTMGTTRCATVHAKRYVICVAGCRCQLRLSLSTDRRANMDVLVSLGTNASYAYSIISILHHHLRSHHVTGAYRPTDFFETAAMLARPAGLSGKAGAVLSACCRLPVCCPQQDLFGRSMIWRLLLGAAPVSACRECW